jgi:hypothetical protein
VGSAAEGVFCHKPCTVSGGGKSEISKSIRDAILGGPVFVADFQEDMASAEEILQRNFSDRFKNPPDIKRGRSILDERRSLGSVIKLLTPSRSYTDEYNDWLGGIPMHIRDLVFTVKRFYQPEWKSDWGRLFSVDAVNGQPGKELKFKQQKLVAQYLRVALPGMDFGARSRFEKISFPRSSCNARMTFPPASYCRRELCRTSGMRNIAPRSSLSPTVSIVSFSDPMTRFYEVMTKMPSQTSAAKTFSPQITTRSQNRRLAMRLMMPLNLGSTPRTFRKSFAAFSTTPTLASS